MSQLTGKILKFVLEADTLKVFDVGIEGTIEEPVLIFERKSNRGIESCFRRPRARSGGSARGNLSRLWEIVSLDLPEKYW